MTAPCEILQLPTRHIGRRFYVYDSVTSTNDVATSLGIDPRNEGAVVLTQFQTAGRGQYGRTWQSQPGESVLMSVIIRPPAELQSAVALTAWAAVGVGDAIFSLTGSETRIKWPNDLLLHGRKVCGILTERSSSAIVGIGLNLNQSHVHLADLGLPGATSLKACDGVTRNAIDVAVNVAQRLDDGFDRLLREGPAWLEGEWMRRVGLLGQPVSIELVDGSSTSGRLIALTFAHLELQTEGAEPLFVRPDQVRQLNPL